MTVAQCLTCGWRGGDFDRPRRAAGEGCAHKRKNPTHQVVIDREQSRSVKFDKGGGSDGE
jgi:hypothetical protein